MTTFAEISRRKRDLLRAAASHKAHKLRVFGSVARGEERPDPGVGFLMDSDAVASRLDLVGSQQDIEALLGRRADVVTADGVSPSAPTDPGRSEASVRRESVVVLKHTRLCLGRIDTFTIEGEAAFHADAKTQDAVIRYPWIIGQAVRDLGLGELESRHPDIAVSARLPDCARCWRMHVRPWI